jgi:5'-methylthioinosine phosphorylase
LSQLAIIGGTGLTSLESLDIVRKRVVSTPYGETSAPLIYGKLAGEELIFLPRHGYSHTIPAHRVNYRANLWALRQVGVENVIAVAAVGGICKELIPGRLAIPDQVIDYTWGRAHTFFEDNLTHVTHVDFTRPYCERLRLALIESGRELGLKLWEAGTYGATQGPRLETAAEIRRMERDGCDMVGMTGMPETALARELGLAYAACAVSSNWAAGKVEEAISMTEIEATLDKAMEKVAQLLQRVVSRF